MDTRSHEAVETDDLLRDLGAAALLPHLGHAAFGAPAPSVALLVEEDGSDRRRLAHDLASRGFSVETADDRDGALATARRRRPALVVLELRLRAGTGLEVISDLRSELPSTRFVVVTHYGSVATAVKAMRLGATHYLCKPAAVAEILNAAAHSVANDVEGPEGRPGVSPAATPTPSLTLDEAIWEYINRAVEDAGSLSEAARRLGLWRQSLKRMLSKYRPSGGPIGAAAASLDPHSVPSLPSAR